MEACAAGYEQKPTTSTDLIHVLLDPAQNHVISVKVDAASHCVHDRLRLLKYLFLHERAVVTCKVIKP